MVAAGALAGLVPITATVNDPANHRFMAGELTGPEAAQVLNRWAGWHHVRIDLGPVPTERQRGSWPNSYVTPAEAWCARCRGGRRVGTAR